MQENVVGTEISLCNPCLDFLFGNIANKKLLSFYNYENKTASSLDIKKSK